MQPFDQSGLLSGADIGLAVLPDMVLRRLDPTDYDLLLRFRTEIVSAVANPDLLRLMPKEGEYVAESLHSQNLVMGLFQDSKLLAYDSLFLPNTDADLRELYIYEHTKGRAPAAEIAFAGGLMVAPAFRGHSLQRRLIEVRQAVMEKMRRPHQFSTVGFGNYFSWRNALATGARVVDVYDFVDSRYGPTSRMFCHWNPAAPPLAVETVWLDCLDIDSQRVCLKQRLVGTCYRMSNSRAEIGYRQEIA